MLAWASAREWPLTARRRIATGAGAVSEPKSGERRCKPAAQAWLLRGAAKSRSPVDRFPRPVPRRKNRHSPHALRGTRLTGDVRTVVWASVHECPLSGC